MSERTFDDFNSFADEYRTIHTENLKLSGADSFYFARMKVELLRSFEVSTNLELLDLGCGDGATEIFMRTSFPSWQIKGIDVSGKSIGAAKAKQIPGVSFSTYDGLNIPFSENQFDVLFIAGVLHHVDEQFHHKIIADAYRVLKPGGRLYLFEHNPLNPLTKYLVKTCVFDKDAKLLGNTYTARLLRKNNFRIDKKRFIIFFPRKGILSRLVFLEKYLHWIPLGGQYFFRAVK